MFRKVYILKKQKNVLNALNYFFNWGVYIEKYKKPSDD